MNNKQSESYAVKYRSIILFIYTLLNKLWLKEHKLTCQVLNKQLFFPNNALSVLFNTVDAAMVFFVCKPLTRKILIKKVK